MNVQNYELERLTKKRDLVRMEVNKLMKSKDYYTNKSLYDRVKALTGLECYLNYRVEALASKLTFITDDDTLV